MKKLNFLLIAFLTLSISSVTFISCEKDDDPVKDEAYVGTWESAIYPEIDLVDGTIKGSQKMVFKFTNTTFEGTIYAGAIGATTDAEIKEATAMKGTMVATATQMTAEVTEISAQGGPFTSKESDPEAFEKTFEQTVGTLLDETFVVDYEITEDKMKFTLPVVLPDGNIYPQVLNLTKVE